MAYSSSSSSSSRGGMLVVIGLNPALQKRFHLSPTGPNPTLIPGNVHRASRVTEGIGGKGQDVAISLQILLDSNSNSNSNVKVAQFVGRGPEGDRLLSLCSSFVDEEWTVRSKSKLRLCTTITSSKLTTELVEPSGIISSLEVEELLSKVKKSHTMTTTTAVKGICFMGSMPPGCPNDLYANLYSIFANNIPCCCCLIDSVVGLSPLFSAIAHHKHKNNNDNNNETQQQVMFKVNIQELTKLANASSSSQGAEVTTVSSREQICGIIEEFFKLFSGAKHALNYIAVTNGKHPAHLVKIGNDRHRVWKFPVPTGDDMASTNDDDNRDPVLYPIGAGDTVAAGTLAAWQYLLSNDDDDNKDDTSSHVVVPLDERVMDLLQQQQQTTLRNEGDDDAVTALSFGLACGSASCWNEENSVFAIEHATRLFGVMYEHRINGTAVVN